METSYFKEQLQAKEDMLAQTTRFLVQTQHKLEEKNKELVLANKDIFDSINFAALIQNSLLPDIDILKIFFKDASFKIMQQIGIGGDTVFIKNTNNGVVFGLLDSTGHGVPAAMLSISGTLLLKELMTSMEIDNPQTLFNLLNYQLHKTFNNSSSSIAHKEGVIFSFSSSQNKLIYSSAKGKALLLHKTGEFEELANTKKSLGDDANTEFELFDMKVTSGDKLIMYSDGLTDQFGGEKNKKFSRDRLKKILSTRPGTNAGEMVKIIEEEFTIWKSTNAQTDDVSFMIIEF
ncbi:MAG: SpoIIE family protein phosphatase [Bacteroidota bacterium]|nr:SpoIIE family protein phosphatase [Bacteroidota bacterium]